MRHSITAMKTLLFAFFLSCLGAGAAVAGIDIHIDTSVQRMSVAVNGIHRYTWKVSTGKSGYATPSGTFRPFRMEPDHFSTEWDNAPMPHSIFFTYQGHAIHGSPHTRRLGRAVSHGCVRLAPRDAAMLYSLVGRLGLAQTRIMITDGAMANAGNSMNDVSPTMPKAVPKSNRGMRYWPWDKRRRN